MVNRYAATMTHPVERACAPPSARTILQLTHRLPGPLHGQTQPLGKRDARPPTEDGPRPPGVEVDALDLPRARRLVDGLGVEPDDALELAEDLIHGGRDPGAEIEHLPATGRE